MRMRRTISEKISRIVREEAGTELVEFAISIMVVLTLVFGVMDFCRAAYSYHFVSYAAQEGARYAVVHGYGWHGSGYCDTSAPPNFTASYDCEAKNTDVQNYVKNLSLPLINAGSLAVTASWPGTTPDCTGSCSACSTTNSSGCYVKVKVSYTFAFITPFLPKSASFSFNGTSEKVIQE